MRPRVATHEKVRAFDIEPFPDFDGVFQHFLLHTSFVRLIA